RRGPSKSATLNKGCRNAQHSRLFRLIQIQTTGILTSRNSQRVHAPSTQLPATGVEKTQFPSPILRVEIVMDGLIAGRNEFETARACVARVESKRATRHSKNTRRRNQPNCERAAARIARRIQRRQPHKRKQFERPLT